MKSKHSKQLTASEMGKESWKARKKKYTEAGLAKIMSENGKKGGRPKGFSPTVDKSA